MDSVGYKVHVCDNFDHITFNERLWTQSACGLSDPSCLRRALGAMSHPSPGSLRSGRQAIRQLWGLSSCAMATVLCLRSDRLRSLQAWCFGSEHAMGHLSSVGTPPPLRQPAAALAPASGAAAGARVGL
ncbi:unnamed protein product [Polarella glacialis]|uniref:Uncharacterized protein n=1 Tax=Polarella glacialis TaxID=89957 RepID=A0A813J747_POLGL|nr:unnamed protein product [Polarella glacialis]